jgi:hypothetical protein
LVGVLLLVLLVPAAAVVCQLPQHRQVLEVVASGVLPWV